MSDEYCLIRNATSALVYGGKRFLIDPVLAQKGAYPAFQRTINADLHNPLVDLPMPVEDVVRDVDAVIVTNVHRDHWDEAAAKALPKGLLLLANNEEDAAALTSQGFTNVEVMAQDGTDLGNGITLHKAPCQYELEGSAAQAQEADAGTRGIITSTGLVFQRPNGKTVYFVSDSVFFAGVEEALTTYKPDFVIVNVGDASVEGVGHIMMGKDDVPRILKAAPDAVVIAQRLEAANHCVLSRQILREFVGIKGVASHVFIPADGECVPVSN